MKPKLNWRTSLIGIIQIAWGGLQFAANHNAHWAQNVMSVLVGVGFLAAQDAKKED